MIGVGMVADTHALACRDSALVELVGVCARSEASAARYAEVLGRDHNMAVRAFGSLAEVAASDVDFVIVTTPPDARMELVETLAAAGKPVLMEKPVERSLSAARSLVQLCEGRVPLGVLFQHRAAGASKIMREKLSELGAIHAVEITAPWWRDQSYYDEPGRGTYARDGGGVLMTQAIHVLDLALSFTGPVRTVQAFARTSVAHEMEAEDFVSAGLEFASGAVGSLVASTASFPGSSESIKLHGAHASAEVSRGELIWHGRDGSSETFGAAAFTGSGADPMAFSHALHQGIIEDFAQAITQDRPPLVTGQEALKVHALIDALTRSSRDKKQVEVTHV